MGYKGLISGHAYTLLNVLELSTGEKLARVRNPWSQGEWKGDWSDASSKWTAALKEEAGYVNANDGQFFMPFKTFTEQYWGTSVALYQEYAGYQVINAEQSARSVYYTVTNPVEQELYIVGETWANKTTQGAASQVTATSCSSTIVTTSRLDHMDTLGGADSLWQATSEQKCQRETTQFSSTTRGPDHKSPRYHSTSIGLIKLVLLLSKNEANSS